MDVEQYSDEEYEYIYSDGEDEEEEEGEDNDADNDNNEAMSLEMETENSNYGHKSVSSSSGATTKRQRPGTAVSVSTKNSLKGSGTFAHNASSMNFNRAISDNNIRMVSTDEIFPVMQKTIADITDILAIPTAAAQPLLRHHKWNKDRLFESYTEDPDKEINNAGVYFRCTNQNYKPLPTPTSTTTTTTTTEQKPIKPTVNKPVTRSSTAVAAAATTASNSNTTTISANHYCAICFDDELKQNEMLLMPCGHEFCVECWKCQIKTKLEEGPSCILATCPQAKCNELVTEEEVAIATPDLLSKYQSYQLRNFVEMNGKSRWCPGAGCDRIAAITSLTGSISDADSIIATCDKCTTCFCLKCGNEPHAPLLCQGLDKWKEKCKNESETANWILANTKPCPKCRARIEKNQGCNHMTCQHCKYEFCWICSGDWKDHGSNTGGYYNCNKFENKDQSDDQSDAAKAKRELDRYLHYYKRYHAHAEAQKFAMKQLKETGNKMVLLQECKSNTTWSDVEFLKTANEQLVECRRVLKYTYVLAYYMSTPINNNSSSSTGGGAASASKEKGNVSKGKRKAGQSSNKEKKDDKVNDDHTMLSKEEEMKKMQKERFEYHQEMLERFTECLSEMTEKPLKEINRTEVVNLTRVVKNFMQKILEYVENGMDDN